MIVRLPRISVLSWPLTSIVSCWLIWAVFAKEPNDASEISKETAPSYLETPITATDREHWSLQPIVRPTLPVVKNHDLVRNPIDLFILRELEEEDLRLSPPAGRRDWIRRLKFDLLGLPPEVGEVEAFVRDQQPNAYERIVDLFLASPAYGERWSQHWLDLARFAETDGFEHDKLRQDAWKYRDWVIHALNDDLPYDQFIRAQIAGDLTTEGVDPEPVATMFCLAGPDMPDINEQDLRRHDKLNELTATVGSVILGLQFQCAQCHDHKYDPISQADFYRLRAIFESAIPLMQRDRHQLVLHEQENPQPGRFYHRGELSGAGAALAPGLPRLAVNKGAPYLCSSSTPRLEFCDWLFSRDNPLTARVIVNRVWQHHFGSGLTENPSDFGVVAGGPSHPELMDWLACELMEHNWSLKHLHRLILNSAVYRQASTPDDAKVFQADPQNELYSRFPRRRLEGETIRDAMLMISGKLDREMGGESVYPALPPELLGTLLKNQWKTSESEAERCRRSIYIFARRNLRFPIFDVFDRPDAGSSCAFRDRSTTAIQSLLMLNSDFSWNCAQALSQSLCHPLVPETAEERCEWIGMLFQRCLARPASLEELAWFEELLNADGPLKEA